MRMFSSKLVPVSIAIAFSFGRAKTIQERNVSTRIFFLKTEKTISVFKQTRIREDGALLESETVRKRHILTLVQWNLHVRPPTISYHLSKTPKLSQSKSYGWNLY